MNKKENNAFYYLFIVTYLFLLINGCKSDETIKPNLFTQNYVSNDAGRWIIYDCDSLVHLDNDNNTDKNVDTFHFQIKEVIDSLGTDGENQPVQNLTRFTRKNDTLPWTFLRRWTAKITTSGYQKVEENIRYLKLGFPITYTQKWNGNAFNMLGEEDYFYGAIAAPDYFRSFIFDSTITVVQGDSTIGYHEYPYGIEKYAAGIGMYYHYYAAVDFLPGSNKIVTGTEYHENMNSYGHY